MNKSQSITLSYSRSTLRAERPYTVIALTNRITPTIGEELNEPTARDLARLHGVTVKIVPAK